MPVDYYPQKTEEELLVILDSVQKRASVGLVNFSTAAGVQNQKTVQGSDRTSIELRRILYSLHLRNSTTWADPYAQRIRKTRANYTADPGLTVEVEE